MPDAARDTWIRLLVGDDWGCKYYRRDGHLTPSETYSARDDGRKPLTNTPAVRFQDGTEERVQVTMQHGRSSVYDHGQSYNVDYSLPCFVKIVCGAPITMRFDAVEVLASEWDGP